MAFTQSDIDQLDAVILQVMKGKTVRYGDREVGHHDLDQLTKLRTVMQTDGASSASSGGGRTTFASFASD